MILISKIICFSILVIIVYHIYTILNIEHFGVTDLIKNAFSKIGKMLKTFFVDPPVNAIKAGFNIIKDLTLGPIIKILGKFKDKALTVGDVISGVFNTILDGIKPLFTKIKELIGTVAKQIVKGIKDVINVILDKFKSILKNIYEVLSGIYSGVLNTLDPLVGKMSSPLDNFGKILGSLVGKIEKVMVGTVKTFTKSLKTVFKYMKKISNTLLSAVEKMFKIIYKIVIFLLNYVIVPLNYAVEYLTVFFKILQNPKYLIQRLSKIYFSIINYVDYKYNHYYNIVNKYVKSTFTNEYDFISSKMKKI